MSDAKKLSSMDASFLYLETPEMPMHVGFMAIFLRLCNRQADGRSPCSRHASAFPAFPGRETTRPSRTAFWRHSYFPPADITRRLGGASGVRRSWGSGRHDCAFSGAAYAMANGPDRSNWLNSPSPWSNRSATAHNAAGVP